MLSEEKLTSLLLGPYKGIKWVLFDPSSGRSPVQGGTQANLMSRKRFVD
jgi:hypothetical protein